MKTAKKYMMVEIIADNGEKEIISGHGFREDCFSKRQWKKILVKKFGKCVLKYTMIFS